MSVTGLSVNTKQPAAECFILDGINENTKTEAYGKSPHNDVKLKDKIFTSRMRTKPAIVLIIFIFGLSCAVAFLSYLYTSNGWTKYCLTPRCKRSEKNLLESINFSVDPCDNFYEFACGNWPNYHPIPEYSEEIDIFEILQNQLLEDISTFLSVPPSEIEPQPVTEAKILYKSCVEVEKHNENVGFRPIEELLLQLKLPILPPLGQASDNFSWVHTTILSKELLNKDFFIQLSVSSDITNRTFNSIHLSKPSSESPLPVYRYRHRFSNKVKTTDTDETNEPEDDLLSISDYNITDQHVNALMEYITKVGQYVYEHNELQWTDEIEALFNKSTQEMIVFYYAAEEIGNIFYSKDSILNYIAVDRLQDMVNELSEQTGKQPIIDWKIYFSYVFENVENVTLNFEEEDSEIIIQDLQYIESILRLITKTSPRIIEYYMWWSVVQILAPYTDNTLQSYYTEYIYKTTYRKKMPRNIHCAYVANELLGVAVAYSIVNNTEIKENIEKVSEMIQNIQSVFSEEVKNLEWMDNQTKEVTLRKLKAMKKFIGYPTWLNDTEELEAYYDGVEMHENEFLNNVLVEIQRRYGEMLKLLRTLNDFDDEEWISNPLDANAFYYLEGNSITIPASILQFPFYEHGIDALDYGSIGSVIGHEISHGFDSTGKEHDDNGNINPWWTNETIDEYEKRSQCFVDYYDSFKVSNELQVNGEKTLDENIADNGGLRIAFHAYRNHIQRSGPDPVLPQLKNYSGEQLFFISFANTWCLHQTQQSLEEGFYDEHSPHNVRVIGTLINSKEFAQIWKCKKGSPMNPKKEKCRIW